MSDVFCAGWQGELRTQKVFAQHLLGGVRAETGGGERRQVGRAFARRSGGGGVCGDGCGGGH